MAKVKGTEAGWTFRPLETTMQRAMANAAAGRLVRAIRAGSDDTLKLLADDYGALIDYINVLAQVITSPANIGDLGAGGEALVEGFTRWLSLPPTVTDEALKALVQANRAGQDVESAPPDTLTPAEKN